VILSLLPSTPCSGKDPHMVSISQESPPQTERRLRRVIESAELVALEGEWSFQEAPLDRPPVLTEQMLAVVRDDHVWSWLAPTAAGTDDDQRFAVFSFHFPDGVDNSGFVGWLATRLKARLGTGVFVVCGQNSARGGIFDYWGFPTDLRHDAIMLLAELRRGDGEDHA